MHRSALSSVRRARRSAVNLCAFLLVFAFMVALMALGTNLVNYSRQKLSHTVVQLHVQEVAR